MNSFLSLHDSPFLLLGFLPMILFGIMAWSLFWKGMALWHAAQRKEKGWFIVLLLVNTLGILEIIYLFAVAKVKRSDIGLGSS